MSDLQKCINERNEAWFKIEEQQDTIKQQSEEIERLRESLKQILGWRELRDTNDIPIERIEDVAREALTSLKGGGR